MCFTKPNYEAFCAFTLEGQEMTIDKDTWYSIQPGRFSLSPEDFALYQKFVEKACELTTCTKKEKALQEKAMRNLEQVKRQYESSSKRL